MLESLSIVFPMFNEKQYIGRTIEKTLDVLKDVTDDYEIIIVDDASTDGCGQIADELSRRNPCIKVAHHQKNRKLGGSLKTGFNLVRKKYALYFDMDMPFDLLEIRRAAGILFEERADFISVYRLNRGADGIKRYIYSLVYNFFIRCLFDLKIKDINFSFKLIRTDLLRRLNLSSEGSFIDAEILIKAKRSKAKIVQFGTQYFPRKNGKSKLSSLATILKILQEAFIFRFGLLQNSP
jgi:glycosyltransferase involved in cell wall biosynthesis